MPGIGTIVNVITVLVGGFIGLFIKKGVPERFSDIIMKALGLSTIFIGVSGTLCGLLDISSGTVKTKGTMLMIMSLVIGSVIGEALKIEDRLEKIGDKLKSKVNAGSSSFTEGFVNTTLIICVGAMAIVGSLSDGIMRDPSTLFAKSILDGVICIIFASTQGIGVLFSAIPLAIYQGGITLLSKFIAPYLTDMMIADMGYVGSVLIFTIGINLAFGKKFKSGNMLPAVLVPIVYNLLLPLFEKIF